MNQPASTHALPPVLFEDHLGQRFDAVSPEGEPVEVFELKEHFSRVPSFEYALRKRVNTLTSFKDPSYATARGVRLGGGLAVVSDRVQGIRLSTMLETLERRSIPLEFNAAICVLRQLVPAVAILHEAMTEVCHGAIAPERIVITPQGRVVLVEHVLATALEALHYSDQQYWEELRLAVPKTVGPACFDQRSDVVQLGLVALALIHGRSLNDEAYPIPTASLVDRAWGVTPAGGLEPLPAAVRAWLTRALQIEPRQAFASGTSAWADLRPALAPSNQAVELKALKSAVGQCTVENTNTVLISTPAASSRHHAGPALPALENTDTVLFSSPEVATPPSRPVSEPLPAVDNTVLVSGPQMAALNRPVAPGMRAIPESQSFPTPTPSHARSAASAAAAFNSPATPGVRGAAASPSFPTPTPTPSHARSLASAAAAFDPQGTPGVRGMAASQSLPTPAPSQARNSGSTASAFNAQPASGVRGGAEQQPSLTPKPFHARNVAPAAGFGSHPAAGSHSSPTPKPFPRRDVSGAVASPGAQPTAGVQAASELHAPLTPRGTRVAGSGPSKPATDITTVVLPKRADAPTPFAESMPDDSLSEFLTQEEQDDMTNSTPWWRRRWVAAVLVVVALAGAGVAAGRSYFTPAPAAVVTGTLIVNTNPPGVAVVVDGKRHGETPVTLEVAPGSHVLTLLAEGSPRTIPFDITAGATVSQFVEVPRPAMQTGQLEIRTNPSGARVTVDGTPRGVSPVMVEGLTPGVHRVDVANDLGSVRQDITVEAGLTASLTVPMSAPQGAPISGWITITAPVDVQVYEDVRLLGSSRSDRLMVSVGRHELDIVNETLGFRTRRVVNVQPGQVANVRIELPTGSMSINAQPWAEVFINGQRIGETPIANVSVPIGTHEVLFRHPELGEQTVRSTVTLGTPARLSVDLRK